MGPEDFKKGNVVPRGRYDRCPVSLQIESIAIAGDQEAADRIANHISTCEECKKEAVRVYEEIKSNNKIFTKKNFFTGMGIFGAIGLALAANGVSEAIQHRNVATGGDLPFWRKYLKKDD